MTRTPSPPLGVEYVLLGFLAQRPFHGYELHKRLTDLEGIGLVWSVKQGNLYALLEKLEKQGLVIPNPMVGNGHMPKKEYCLTDTGRRVFDTWRSTPVGRASDMRQDFLARLYFARLNSRQAAAGLLRNQMMICRGWLSSLQDQKATLKAEHEYERTVCEFRIRETHAILEWLEWSMQSIGTQTMTSGFD